MTRITTMIIAFLMLLTIEKTNAQATQNITFRSNLPYPYALSNIWGYVDETGKEYALVGTDDGLSVVNVTNPDSIWKICDVTAATSIWREVKQWKDFAYTVTEGGGGLMITDLRPLPVAAPTPLPNSFFSFSGQGAGHTVFIDEKGILYIFGAAGASTNGALIYDVDSIPGTPIYLGSYANATSSYIHDGYARGDTLYSSHIYGGFFAIVNVQNPAAPITYNTQTTPSNFTHNAWLTNNSKHLLTTDEVNNAYLAAYNIENPANIQETDRIQSSKGGGSIPHNVHIIQGDWAVTAWYRDGILIHDASRPHNLVEVGYYDSSDQYAGGGFNGAWGVYPYLPSGNILISDIEEGLFVVTPTYKKGCYLEGFVTDSLTGQPISGANIQIVNQFPFDDSKSAGNYALGIATAGTYNVRYSKPGYAPKTISAVLANGVLNLQNVALRPLSSIAFGGLVQETNGNAIAGAKISIQNPTLNYNATSNASGNFNINPLIPDTYEITVAKWGYETRCFTQNIGAPLTTPIVLKVQYQDDFSFDLGWTAQTTASAGAWQRGEPAGTTQGTIQYNPDVDASGDCGNQAYITGNAGGNVGADDVDNGATTLTSPAINLAAYSHPFLTYDRWFANGGGSGNPNDSLVISIDNGTTSVVIETALNTNFNNNTWVRSPLYNIKNLLPLTNNMHLRIRTADAAPGHLVEAAFDNFKIIDSIFVGNETVNLGQNLQIYPNPSQGNAIVQYELPTQKTANLYITNILGETIKIYALNPAESQMIINEKLPIGVYNIQINQDSKHYAPQKWVITR